MSECDIIERSFRPLIGLPCWNARRSHGSIMMMEFGEPHLRIREPKGKLRNRLVIPRGQWGLFIYLCNWIIDNGDNRIAHSESANEEMDNAIAFLDGQSLVSVNKGPRHAALEFCFDLAGRIRTFPYEQDSDEEQWTLYEPNGWALNCTASGELRRIREGSNV